MDALDLQFSRETEVALVTVKGRVDGKSCEQFGEFLTENILESDRIVILDLAGLGYISSAGLRQLTKLARRLNKVQVKATLVGVTPVIAQTLEIAGFRTLFHQYPTVAAALKCEASPGRLARFFTYFTGRKQ